MTDTFKYANDNIKLLLKFKGWTQSELCKKTGITQVTLARRFSGTGSKWNLEESLAIARVFNMSVNDIFFTRLIPNGSKTELSDDKPA
jgi:transcriptional regulator with XRE-family HTH domain